MKFSICITTYNKQEIVNNIIDSFKKNANNLNISLKFYISVSNTNIDINPGSDIKIYKVPEDYFWARSFKYLLKKLDTDTNKIIHINDDTNLSNEEFKKFLCLSMNSDVVVGNFFDADKNHIFGFKRFIGRSFRPSSISEAKFFNGNLFMSNRDLLIDSIPSYTYKHGFLDYHLSFQIIKILNNRKLRIAELNINGPVETNIERKTLYKSIKDPMNSRMNPFDQLFFYISIRRPFFGCISFILNSYRAIKFYTRQSK